MKRFFGYILVIRILLFSSDVYAFDMQNKVHLSIGTDIMQSQYNSQRIRFGNFDAFKRPDLNITRVSVGITYKPFDDYYIYITGRTNRLVNAYAQMQGFDTVMNVNVNVYQKVVADSLILSAAIHKNIVPYIVASRTTSNTIVIYPQKFTSESTIHTMLYGFGFSVPFQTKHSISITYFLANKDFNTKRIIGLSYNYFIL